MRCSLDVLFSTGRSRLTILACPGCAAVVFPDLPPRHSPIERARAIGEWRDKYPDPRHLPEVRKWLSQVGEYADDLLALLPALAVSRFPFPVSRFPKVVESIRAAKDPLTLKDLAITGDDLIAAGVRPRPRVGETLARLLADVLDDPTRNTREQLLTRV